MQPDKEKLARIITELRDSEHERYNIGTLREKILHLVLKKYLEEDPAFHEIETNGYVADIRRDGIIYEIETSGFSGLGPKLSAYLDDFRVYLVLPLARRKHLCWMDPGTGELSKKHVSPKKENEYDLLFELVRILPYINHPNLHILGFMMDIEELRIADGWSRDGKKGSHRIEKIPLDIEYIAKFSTDDDYGKFIPGNCVADFTVKDFCKGAKSLAPLSKKGLDTRTAYAVIRVLEARGLISKTGKSGRSNTYSRTAGMTSAD